MVRAARQLLSAITKVLILADRVVIKQLITAKDQVHKHTHTHPFNGPLSGTTQVSQYKKGKTNPDFTDTRDSEWQWHQLGHMQVCILLQTDNLASTPPLRFLQAGCSSCCPTNSIKALKAMLKTRYLLTILDYQCIWFRECQK